MLRLRGEGIDFVEPLFNPLLLPMDELLPLAGEVLAVFIPTGPSSLDGFESGNIPVETTARFIDFSSVLDSGLRLSSLLEEEEEDFPMNREMMDDEDCCCWSELLFEGRLPALVLFPSLAVSADCCLAFLFLSDMRLQRYSN